LIVLDANIVVSAIVGPHTRGQLSRLLDSGADLAVPAPQLSEALDVLIRKLGMAAPDASALVEQLSQAIRVLEPVAYAMMERSAGVRLHERAQNDWPILAAAMAFDADVWSNDRDFFGIGVALWSTRNVHFAAAGN
jgi:predicted nucleic acid-binding protein